ncbi:MAG TPA: hypothetical protein PKD27_04350 [Tepidiformaceae bacterium]|nr:hypothetical protein [Tepidiformaceae bacterium]
MAHSEPVGHHLFREVERTVHPQRFEDAVPDDVLERLAAQRLNNVPELVERGVAVRERVARRHQLR